MPALADLAADLAFALIALEVGRHVAAWLLVRAGAAAFGWAFRKY